MTRIRKENRPGEKYSLVYKYLDTDPVIDDILHEKVKISPLISGYLHLDGVMYVFQHFCLLHVACPVLTG